MAAIVRWLADMNLSPVTVVAPRQQGHDIIVGARGAAGHGLRIGRCLELARREEWVVLTQDLDFGALLAIGGYDRPSVVTLRLAMSDPDTVTRRLLEVLPEIAPLLRLGCAATIEPGAVRVRRLPIG